MTLVETPVAHSSKTLVFTLGILALTSAAATAQQPVPEESHALAAENRESAAESSAEHKAAAQRFQDEAAQFEKQAAEHEQMAADYRKRARALPKYNYAALAEHCDRLAKNLKAAAAEARETAKLHETVAKLETKQ